MVNRGKIGDTRFGFNNSVWSRFTGRPHTGAYPDAIIKTGNGSFNAGPILEQIFGPITWLRSRRSERAARTGDGPLGLLGMGGDRKDRDDDRDDRGGRGLFGFLGFGRNRDRGRDVQDGGVLDPDDPRVRQQDAEDMSYYRQTPVTQAGAQRAEGFDVSPARMEQFIDSYMEKYDANRDNKITLAEHLDAMLKTGNLPADTKKEFEEAITTAGIKLDEKSVTREQVKQHFTTVVQRLDMNGDGTLFDRGDMQIVHNLANRQPGYPAQDRLRPAQEIERRPQEKERAEPRKGRFGSFGEFVGHIKGKIGGFFGKVKNFVFGGGEPKDFDKAFANYDEKADRNDRPRFSPNPHRPAFSRNRFSGRDAARDAADQIRSEQPDTQLAYNPSDLPPVSIDGQSQGRSGGNT